MHGTYHGQPQTLYTPSQLQRVAMSGPCRQKYSRRPCCSTLTNACGMKMLSKKNASTISAHIDIVALQLNHWLDWRNLAVGLERSKQRLWSPLSKSLYSQKVSVTWTQKMDQKLVPEKMSWATASRFIWKCKTRIEKIGDRVSTLSQLRVAFFHKSHICCR